MKRGSVLVSMGLMGLISIFLMSISSCHEKKKSGGFTVTGSFSNADKLAFIEGPISKVYLMEVPNSGKEQAPVILDSVKIMASNGRFSLTGPAKAQEMYELVFGNNALVVPLVNDTPEVTVNVDLGKKDDFYDVTGSPASGQLKDLINVFGKKNFEVEKSMADLDSLKRLGAPDSVLLAATARKNNVIQDLNTYLKQFINTNSNPTLCTLGLTWSSRSFSRTEFETCLGDLVKRYPDNVVLQNLKQSYEQQLSQMTAAGSDAAGQQGSWIGKQAPDLSLPDAHGKVIPISSFKGKYLLVDFWASWCGPCRAENPNVVKAYGEFRNKNFAILGVSLDKDRDAWQEAVQADKLDWTHVSDLKYWSSKAVETFGFNGIPYNVLIDPQGKVIGESLRGDDLENKLKEVMP